MRRMRFVITVLFVAAVAFTAYKTVPVIWAAMQFRSALDDQARRSSYTKDSPDEIKALVIRQAQDLDLSVQPEDVEVERLPTGVSIKVNYTVTIDLLVHELDLKFSPSATNTRPY